MTLSTSKLNNTMIEQYMSQIKNQNSITDKDTTTLRNEKAMQQFAFQTMLAQMTDSSGNSMMAELLSTALSEQESFNLDDSLGAISNFNSSMRGVARTVFNDNNQFSDKISGLGGVAVKYESNGNPGAISNTPGDYGGKSYGAWQFSSKTGSLDSFISSLKDKNKEFYTMLSDAKAKDGNGFGENFDAAWTSISVNNKDKFLNFQQDCVKQNYYDKAAQSLKSKYGFDISKKSSALKESLWSTVVQHGVGGTLSVFSKLNLNSSDSNIINDLYNERQNVDLYFRSSSSDVKLSVYNRFTREKQDMLNMFNEETV